MGKHDGLAKTLAITGTVLVMLPILMPVLTSLLTFGGPGGFRIDYLIPFEIFPLTLIGMIYLVGGSFIDDMAFMILATPIFYPVILKLGFDLIWFGIFLQIVVMIGVIIPPMAINIFVVNNITKVRPSLIIKPQSGVGGWAPKPRKLSAETTRITLPISSEACTISGAIQLGKMCPKIIFRGCVPITLAALTNCRSRRGITCP